MPAGEVGGEPAGKGRQPRELQEFRHAARPGVAVHPVQVGVKGDIFHDRQVAVEAEALGHVADMLPDLVPLAHRVKTQDLRPPLVRVHDAHQEPHHRGLAGAVRAHQGEGLPQGHRQAQVVHRQPRPEPLGEIVDAKRQLWFSGRHAASVPAGITG